MPTAPSRTRSAVVSGTMGPPAAGMGTFATRWPGRGRGGRGTAGACRASRGLKATECCDSTFMHVRFAWFSIHANRKTLQEVFCPQLHDPQDPSLRTAVAKGSVGSAQLLSRKILRTGLLNNLPPSDLPRRLMEIPSFGNVF